MDWRYGFLQTVMNMPDIDMKNLKEHIYEPLWLVKIFQKYLFKYLFKQCRVKQNKTLFYVVIQQVYIIFACVQWWWCEKYSDFLQWR